MTPELQEAIEKCRTVALACNLLTVELVAITEELKELKVNLSLELQAVRDQRVAEHREWREFLAEQRQELDRIKADFRTDAMLLHLIEPPTKEQAGEEAWDRKTKTRNRRSSSLSGTLGQFVKSTN
jgi:hypothetical protein